MMNQGFKRGGKWRTNSPVYLFLQLIQQFRVATRSTSLDMTTVFHGRPYGRFVEIQSNLWNKKVHRTNQGSNFLGGSFSNKDNVRDPIQLRIESQPQHRKDDFSSRTDASILMWITPVLLDWSMELFEFFQHWNHQATSYSSPQKIILVVATEQMLDHT